METVELTTSSKGTVEALFRWMTQRFERRLPNTSHGIHDAEVAAQAGAMTLEELERYFFRAIPSSMITSKAGMGCVVKPMPCSGRKPFDKRACLNIWGRQMISNSS